MHDQEEIIALKAKITAWNKAKHQKEHPQNNSIYRLNKRYPPQHNNCNESNNQPGSNKIKVTLTGSQAWRSNKLTSVKANTKVVKGSTWHFCEHYQAWGRNPSQKSLKGRNTGSSSLVQPMTLDTSTMQVSMDYIGINDIIKDESQKL